MEIEQYCKCDACAKRILKSKAIQLMYSRLCQECFDKMLKLREEAMNQKWEE